MLAVCRVIGYAGVGSTPTFDSVSLPGYIRKGEIMNEPITKLMLMVGDFLINNKVEDAIVKWKDKGENAGSVIIVIKKYKK